MGQSENHVDEKAGKPEPLDFSEYYSVTASHFMPSKIKQFYKWFSIPGIGQLAGGRQRHSSLSASRPTH
jgi:hypothetical protein